MDGVGVAFFVFVRVDVDRFCVAEGCAVRGQSKTTFWDSLLFLLLLVVASCCCCCCRCCCCCFYCISTLPYGSPKLNNIPFYFVQTQLRFFGQDDFSGQG